jgi:hypothetical protein
MRRSGPSLIQQAFALKARFPDATGTVKPRRFVWIGVLQPTPLSRHYRVEINYRTRCEPFVRVLDKLETREGKSLPHVYRGGTLCLYEPGEWNDSMPLTDSIVPWAAELARELRDLARYRRLARRWRVAAPSPTGRRAHNGHQRAINYRIDGDSLLARAVFLWVGHGT